MAPRRCTPFLGVVFLILLILSLCPEITVASTRPIQDGGPGGLSPVSIVDPPTSGGGGPPKEGGDPDEVVIFRAEPGGPVVVHDAASTASIDARMAQISAILSQIRSLLFWAGIAR